MLVFSKHGTVIHDTEHVKAVVMTTNGQEVSICKKEHDVNTHKTAVGAKSIR